MGRTADAGQMADQHIPAPRLCHIVKTDNYEGFGFNLYQEKSKPGQFIGKIEPGSPAYMAGLKEDDMIVEVNGVNIARENHKQVVGRIKAISSETTLLVDKECEEYHRKNSIVVKSSLSYVEHITSDIGSSDEEEYIDTRLQIAQPVAENNENEMQNTAENESHDVVQEQSKVLICQERNELEPKTECSSDYGSLDLNMSVKEMREKLVMRKKTDPRVGEGKRRSS